jgi:hypothetical protein
MAVATRTDSTLASGFTQTTLGDAIKQAFINAGFPAAIDDYVSGTDRFLVFSQVVDSAKTFGTNILRVRISSSFYIFQQLFTSWNSTSKAGGNGSTEYYNSSITINPNSLLSITSLNGGSEYRFVCLSQGSSFWLLGLMAPTNRPTWWDLNSFSYGFIPAGSASLTWRSSNISPYNNTDYDISLGYVQMASANPITNKRDITTGLLLYSRSYAGVACKTSDDLVQCCASGIARYETIQASGNQYLVVIPGTGALAVRVA